MQLEGLELGKYHLIRLIGSGGMGDVYLGEDAGINRQVAIKVMRADTASYPDENLSKTPERLFQREMRAVAMLDHPHILPLYDYGEETLHTTALLYMVMPFREEGSLTDWVRQRSSKKPLQLQEITYFLSQAADALQHAHDHGIIHLDVKPSNFLLRSKRDPSMLPDLLLADFGISRISTLTSSLSQSSRGTPLYMAPEQWMGDPVPATDQYALAVMTYELLTGRPPFRGRPEQLMYLHIHTPSPAPTSLNTSLPLGMDTVLLRALAKNPAERFPSVIDFAQAFQQVLQVSSNLQASLAISRIEASTGTQRELTLPGGRKIQVMVPPGTQDGQVLYLEGMSDPLYAGGPRGSLALTVIISSQERMKVSEGASDKTVQSNVENIPPTIPISNPSQSSLLSGTVPASKAPVDSLQNRLSPPKQQGPLSIKSIEREMSGPKEKREWIAKGDRAVRMGFYQGALQNYEQAAKFDPRDIALLAKLDEVRGRARKEEEERNRHANPRRIYIIAGITLTVLLFLIINSFVSWNVVIFVFTAILGAIIVVSLSRLLANPL